MKQNDPVYILGAGGHAKVVVATLLDSGFKVECLYDDDESKRNKTVLGVNVVGPLSEMAKNKECSLLMAFGDNRFREKIAKELMNNTWVTVVHPSAYVHPSVKIGCGTVIFAGAVIQPGAVVGKHCIVNTGAVIDHDCIIGDYVHIGPGAKLAGNVKVGNRVFMGIGSVAIPGLVIGENSIVGAGGVVISDLPDSVTACGVPARITKATSK